MKAIFYNIKQAFRQIGRNRGMSTASIFSITAMLLILGLFFIITVNLNLFTEVVKADYDLVEVYVEDDASQMTINKDIEDLKALDEVESITFRTKDEALKIMKKRWGESGYLLDSLGENPLPSSLLISIKNVDDAEAVIDKANALPGIESVKYYKETVEKLTKATNFLQTGSLIVMAFLVLVSIIVVSNTVKLTVFARSKEIEIMKYIGATNWFIRGPFLTEGIIIGLFAALVSSGLITLIYSKVVDIIGTDVVAILSSPLVPTDYLAGNLLIIFLALGISIGACGSIVSMRKFLDK
ncbi:MAG: permease-like cell division protein FtsX [Clostridia bacterium]|nr:permease-like cell division protein FtsX [Clostridia bacterium]